MKQKLLLYICILVLIVVLGFLHVSTRDESADVFPTTSTSTTEASGGWQNVDGKDRYIHADGTPASGWTEINGQLHYLNSDGTPLSGWNQVNGKTYYFLEDGTVTSGWLNIDGSRYYLKEDGTPASGWTEIDGQRCWFNDDGTPHTGWTEIDGNRYYLNINGAPLTGTQEIDGDTYVFSKDGTFYNGWIVMNGLQYYCQGNGSFATGEQIIDGKTCYFSPSGIHVLLVNPWRELPEDHQTNLLQLDSGYFVEVDCYQALLQMLADCKAAGYEPEICSAYRTQSDQEYLFRRKIKNLMAEDEDLDEEEAAELAATVVARPGTSEHQLGLAFDIVDEDYPYLDDDQSNTPAQKWLMEHCWEYGFILRYPKGTTHITGIIWEPWHYRYVGTEIALEIRDLGVTLEEYLGFTHD